MSYTFEIDEDWPGKDRFSGAEYHRKLVDWTGRQSDKIKDAIKVHAPVRTGRLRESIHSQRHGEMQWDFVADPPYTKYVVEGTRPHLIFPNHVKALHWVDAHSGDVFAKFVRHPGNRPNDFAVRGVESISEDLRRSFEDEFK